MLAIRSRFLGKELKLPELSAKAVLQYLRLMQALAARDQARDHLDAALLASCSPPQSVSLHREIRRTDQSDLERLIASAKCEVYTAGHGETSDIKPHRKGGA